MLSGPPPCKRGTVAPLVGCLCLFQLVAVVPRRRRTFPPPTTGGLFFFVAKMSGREGPWASKCCGEDAVVAGVACAVIYVPDLDMDLVFSNRTPNQTFVAKMLSAMMFERRSSLSRPFFFLGKSATRKLALFLQKMVGVRHHHRHTV